MRLMHHCSIYMKEMQNGLIYEWQYLIPEFYPLEDLFSMKELPAGTRPGNEHPGKLSLVLPFDNS